MTEPSKEALEAAEEFCEIFMMPTARYQFRDIALPSTPSQRIAWQKLTTRRWTLPTTRTPHGGAATITALRLPLNG